MSLITVDLRDRKQLYEQLTDNIKNLILAGELKADDKLPSVRSLAKELGINPNTIQKAYSELERAGVIVTMQGRGSIICGEKQNLQNENREKLIEKMASLAVDMKISGMTLEEFTDAARSAYVRISGKNDEGGENR